ncbi:hypothetical protein PENTCL1PPCAC_9980 [Pristionchus entomophagus]|uniref:BTB domain-containing protein n=1 Tax=Pristionchus entomophagus TaxID=358040 RepID=A0AAV5SYF6_9BILA|nr:hypothetical protein PENTCL1PPCAC_9980 [Pristionchus entomophagus]
MAEGSQIVSLNIGGRHFTTDVATLKRAHDSFFMILLDKRWRHSPTEEHVMENLHFFIDRDPHHFGLILDHLRRVPFNLPTCSRAIGDIRREAEFYCLDDLLRVMRRHDFHDFGRGPMFPGDRIRIDWRKVEELEAIEADSEGAGHLGLTRLDYLHGREVYCGECGCNSKSFDGRQRAVTERRNNDDLGNVIKVYNNGKCCDATFGSSKLIYHLPASTLDLIYEH